MFIYCITAFLKNGNTYSKTVKRKNKLPIGRQENLAVNFAHSCAAKYKVDSVGCECEEIMETKGDSNAESKGMTITFEHRFGENFYKIKNGKIYKYTITAVAYSDKYKHYTYTGEASNMNIVTVKYIADSISSGFNMLYYDMIGYSSYELAEEVLNKATNHTHQ